MADTVPIKAEGGDGSPTAAATPVDEEDLYEDAGDLEFYDKTAENRNAETMYLARVPKYVWEAWIKVAERLGDNDEIQIGTMRTWLEEKDGRSDTKLRMLLSGDCPEHQVLPREYDLEVTENDVKNHYVFSEEDLPGFKARNKARTDAAGARLPPSVMRARASGEKHTYDRRSRFQPYYRKAIPKKTKIYGRIHYDLRVEPRDKDEETRLLAQHLNDMENNRTKLQIISRNKASTITNPGAGASISWAKDFIKNTAPTVKPKKGEVIKATRMPKNQLLDLIFDCFRQYQYWSMKALRQKTQQPDSYLRQVLEEVAVLNKSGSFANHYCLSEAYRDKAGNDAKKEAAEPVDDADDEEIEEMEDVIPG